MSEIKLPPALDSPFSYIQSWNRIFYNSQILDLITQAIEKNEPTRQETPAARSEVGSQAGPNISSDDLNELREELAALKEKLRTAPTQGDKEDLERKLQEIEGKIKSQRKLEAQMVSAMERQGQVLVGARQRINNQEERTNNLLDWLSSKENTKMVIKDGGWQSYVHGIRPSDDLTDILPDWLLEADRHDNDKKALKDVSVTKDEVDSAKLLARGISRLSMINAGEDLDDSKQLEEIGTSGPYIYGSNYKSTDSSWSDDKNTGYILEINKEKTVEINLEEGGIEVPEEGGIEVPGKVQDMYIHSIVLYRLIGSMLPKISVDGVEQSFKDPFSSCNDSDLIESINFIEGLRGKKKKIGPELDAKINESIIKYGLMPVEIILENPIDIKDIKDLSKLNITFNFQEDKGRMQKNPPILFLRKEDNNDKLDGKNVFIHFTVYKYHASLAGLQVAGTDSNSKKEEIKEILINTEPKNLCDTLGGLVKAKEFSTNGLDNPVTMDISYSITISPGEKDTDVLKKLSENIKLMEPYVKSESIHWEAPTHEGGALRGGQKGRDIDVYIKLKRYNMLTEDDIIKIITEDALKDMGDIKYNGINSAAPKGATKFEGTPGSSGTGEEEDAPAQTNADQEAAAAKAKREEEAAAAAAAAAAAKAKAATTGPGAMDCMDLGVLSQYERLERTLNTFSNNPDENYFRECNDLNSLSNINNRRSKCSTEGQKRREDDIMEKINIQKRICSNNIDKRKIRRDNQLRDERQRMEDDFRKKYNIPSNQSSDSNRPQSTQTPQDPNRPQYPNRSQEQNRSQDPNRSEGTDRPQDPNKINISDGKKDKKGLIMDLIKRGEPIPIKDKDGKTVFIKPNKSNIKQIEDFLKDDKNLDIIRNKDIIDFDNQQIKDLDLMINRYNDLSKGYYNLLDQFYSFKKDTKSNEKNDMILVIQKEKQIEKLKDIIIRLKNNIEYFRNACKEKTTNIQNEHDKMIQDKDTEFREVFNYLKGLFEQEIHIQLLNTKETIKGLKKENKVLKKLNCNPNLTHQKKRGKRGKKGKRGEKGKKVKGGPVKTPKKIKPKATPKKQKDTKKKDTKKKGSKKKGSKKKK